MDPTMQVSVKTFYDSLSYSLFVGLLVVLFVCLFEHEVCVNNSFCSFFLFPQQVETCNFFIDHFSQKLTSSVCSAFSCCHFFNSYVLLKCCLVAR